MIQESILLLASLSLGIFVGAQITEACLFVPSWKALQADDFFNFYKNYGEKIHQFFAPLTIAATVIPLAAAGYGLTRTTNHPLIFVFMGVCTLAFFSTFYLYFKGANRRFFDRSITDDQLAKELNQWGNWHMARVCFAIMAFGASLFLLFVH